MTSKVLIEAPVTTAVQDAGLETTPEAEPGQALEAARAEFRAAWQAQRVRARRLRAHAGKVERVYFWADWIGRVLLLGNVGMLVIGLLNQAQLGDLTRTPAFRLALWSYVLCSLIYLSARTAGASLRRSAERLEAEVQYP